MKNKLFLDMQDRALRASSVLHNQLLTEACYAGYDGDKDAFDILFNEVFTIAREELPDDADVDQIVETFHQYQLEQMNGERDADWYLYV
jgi:hypothetical protein